MKLRLERSWPLIDRTIGRLFVDGIFDCYTCEDAVREGPKIPGKTAIPCGVYKVIINMSKRFKRLMMLLLGVPDFSGIRIHAGNTEADTEGCILVGLEKDATGIFASRWALTRLQPQVQAALDRDEEVTIEIVNMPCQ